MEKEQTVSGNIIDFAVLKRLFVFARPYLRQFWLLVLLTIGVATLGPLRPLLIKMTIDNQVANGDYPGLVQMIALLVILLVVGAIVQYYHTYLSGWLGQYIIMDIRVKLFAHLQKLRLKFFDKTPIGRLVTRNISDIETLAEVFSQGVSCDDRRPAPNHSNSGPKCCIWIGGLPSLVYRLFQSFCTLLTFLRKKSKCHSMR